MEEQLKVCIATTNFPRWKGDFRVPFIYEAARGINKIVDQVTILTMHTPGASKHEHFEDIEIFRAQYLPERYELLQKDASGIPEAWRRSFFLKLATIPYLVSFVRLIGRHAQTADVIHCNWSLSGLAAYLSKWKHKKSYVITVQGSDIFQTINIPVVRGMVRLALKKASHIIALSEDLKTGTKKFGIPDEKITVIPNGVNISQFPMGIDEPREAQIIFVGSLIERKGVNFLIEAMSIIHKECPEAKLLLVGEGKDREEYERMVSELDLGNSITFLGTQSQERVSELLRQSRLFVLPSIEEGQGVVLVEALASGTPCVGSRVGGIPDVISSDVGALVVAGDIKALANAILQYLKDDHLWSQASKSARIRAQKMYNWDELAKRIVKVYIQVLKKR